MKKSKTSQDASEFVKLWDRLELQIAADNDQTTFVSRVENIFKDQITIEKPVRISGETSLQIGSRLTVFVNRQDSAYSFDALISGTGSAEDDLLMIKPISEIQRSQRRKFFRIEISGKMTYKQVYKKSDDEIVFSLDRKADLMNISAGGLLLETDIELRTADLLLLNLRLKDNHRLENVLGSVKRVEESDVSKADRVLYLVGVEFVAQETAGRLVPFKIGNIGSDPVNFFDDALQQVVVRYVYRQQVNSRKTEDVEV